MFFFCLVFAGSVNFETVKCIFPVSKSRVEWLCELWTMNTKMKELLASRDKY